MTTLSILPQTHQLRRARTKTTRRPRRHSRSALAAMRRASMTSLVMGAIVGGFVPLAVYQLAHAEVAAAPALWALVGGGLLFSASTVWDFLLRALGSRVKAGGFVLLVEGVMVWAGTPWLGFAALGLLIGINAVQTGNRMAGTAR